MTTVPRVKAYFNYAGLNWPTQDIAQVCRDAHEKFQALLFSLAGIDEYVAQMLRTRQSVARLMRLEAGALDRILFVPNASAGLSLLLDRLLTELGPGRIAATSDQEHPAIERMLARAERAGARIVRIAAASEDDFIARLAAQCADGALGLVALSHVSYKDGRVLPIRQVAEMLAPRGVPLIIDGNQAVGQVPIDLPAESYAAYVFSGHKWLCAPMSTGAAIVNLEFWRARCPATLDLLNDFQNGTLNYVAMAGLAAGCDLAERSLTERAAALARIKRKVVAALSGLPIVTRPAWDGPTAPGILALLMPEDRPSQELTERLLDRHGVAVKAFVPPERPNAIRISWSPSTTDAEIERLRNALRAELG